MSFGSGPRFAGFLKKGGVSAVGRRLSAPTTAAEQVRSIIAMPSSNGRKVRNRRARAERSLCPPEFKFVQGGSSIVRASRMSEKATARSTSEKAPSRARSAGRNPSSAPPPATAPLSGPQQNLGNQAMLQLLEAGVLQAKLRVSQPGDADEIEADRIADQIVSSQHAPVLQRKCACDGGGTPCAKCAGEDEEKIHRSATGPKLRSSESVIQRSPADASATPAQTAAGAQAEAPADRSKPPAQILVDDEAKTVAPHQMRKSQFIALLRAEACATADAVLMSVGHTTKSCPYIEKWLGFYEKASSQHIEQALHKYAPETAGARNAHEAIRMAVKRVQRAAFTWAKTGKIEGMPKELAGKEQAHDASPESSSASSGGFLGFLSGQKKKDDSSTSVMRKARNGEHAPAQDAASVKSNLGSGHSLDSRVQSQVSSAFGHDFSGVRVHTDSRADSLSSDLQARAFAIGNDVAFAAGEYKPGTLIGDALIAHELAHVVQQSGRGKAHPPQLKGNEDYDSLERDADRSAMGAMMALWTGGTTFASNFAARAVPRLKSGLSLSRCSHQSAAARSPAASGRTSASRATGPGDCPLASPAVKPGVGRITFESSPDYFKKDDAAKAILNAAKDTSIPVSQRAVNAVLSMLHQYYPSHVAEVKAVKFDEKESVLAASRQEVGTLYAGPTFVTNVAEHRTFAHEVLRLGHELEHIQQYGAGMIADARTCEREFCAFTHEGLALEVEHTGLIQRPDRVGTIDTAIGYFYCLKPEDQARYKDTELKRLMDRRQEEMTEIKDPKKHFPSIPSESPPTTCVT